MFLLTKKSRPRYEDTSSIKEKIRELYNQSEMDFENLRSNVLSETLIDIQNECKRSLKMYDMYQQEYKSLEMSLNYVISHMKSFKWNNQYDSEENLDEALKIKNYCELNKKLLGLESIENGRFKYGILNDIIRLNEIVKKYYTEEEIKTYEFLTDLTDNIIRVKKELYRIRNLRYDINHLIRRFKNDLEKKEKTEYNKKLMKCLDSMRRDNEKEYKIMNESLYKELQKYNNEYAEYYISRRYTLSGIYDIIRSYL